MLPFASPPLAVQADFISAIAECVTAAGIVGAAWWAIYRYGLFRDAQPRARISHRISIVDISPELRALRVDVIIENIGQTLLRVAEVQNRIQQVAPLPEVQGGIFDPHQAFLKGEIQWPQLGTSNITFDSGDREIEPGEPDSFQFDYLIPSDVRAVQIYSHVDNVKKPLRKREGTVAAQRLGWTITDITVFDQLVKPKENPDEPKPAQHPVQ